MLSTGLMLGDYNGRFSIKFGRVPSTYRPNLEHATCRSAVKAANIRHCDSIHPIAWQNNISLIRYG